MRFPFNVTRNLAKNCSNITFNKVVECLVFWERMFIENRYACVKVNNFIDDRFAGF